MDIVLKVLSGVHSGAEMILHGGRSYSVGKDMGCDVILADSMLSPVHGNIILEKDLIIFSQEKGRVFLDGKLQIEKQVPLQPFQVVTIGSTHLAIGFKEGDWESISLPSLDNALLYTSDPPEIIDETKKEESTGKRKSLYALGAVVCIALIGGALYSTTIQVDDNENTLEKFKEDAGVISSTINDQYPKLDVTLKGQRVFVSGYMDNNADLQNLQRQFQDAPVTFQVKTRADIIANIEDILNNFSFKEKVAAKHLDGKKFEITGAVSTKKQLARMTESLKRGLPSDVTLVNKVTVKVTIPDIVLNVRSVRTGENAYIILADGRKYREGDKILKDFVLKKIFLKKLIMEYKNSEFVKYIDS